MLSNQTHPDTGIYKDNNFEPLGVFLQIIQFVTIYLPNFKINRNQIDINNIEESYNNQLSMFFNVNCSNEAFQFQHEFIRPNSRRPDIGVPLKAQIIQSQYESIFDIECKRLNSSLPHVKQYVSGNTGGIERFKRNLHGVDLFHSAIIGYVEDKTIEFWPNQINNWIKEQNKKDNNFWSLNEYLEKSTEGYYKSNHSRFNHNSGNSITLYHFFHNCN